MNKKRASYATVTNQSLAEIAIQKALAWFRRKVPSLRDDEEEDMMQVAHLTALEATPNFQPAKGDLAGYLYRAVRTQMGAHLTGARCPVATHGNLLAARTAYGVDMEAAPTSYTAETPLALALERESRQEGRAWEASLQGALTRVFRLYTARDVEIFCRSRGVCGRTEETAREIAADLDLPVATVYLATARILKAIQYDIYIYQHHQQHTEIFPHGIEETSRSHNSDHVYNVPSGPRPGDD